jgi:hypothetical protein
MTRPARRLVGLLAKRESSLGRQRHHRCREMAACQPFAVGPANPGTAQCRAIGSGPGTGAQRSSGHEPNFVRYARSFHQGMLDRLLKPVAIRHIARIATIQRYCA